MVGAFDGFAGAVCLQWALLPCRPPRRPVGEIIPKKEIYDYECKYTPGMAVEEFPARLDADVAARVQEQARLAFGALKLSGCARIDFRITESGETFCLEANTLPGMTETSLIPQAAAAAGMSFERLCERIAELALEGRPAAAGPWSTAPPNAGPAPNPPAAGAAAAGPPRSARRATGPRRGSPPPPAACASPPRSSRRTWPPAATTTARRGRSGRRARPTPAARAGTGHRARGRGSARGPSRPGPRAPA